MVSFILVLLSLPLFSLSLFLPTFLSVSLSFYLSLSLSLSVTLFLSLFLSLSLSLSLSHFLSFSLSFSLSVSLSQHLSHHLSHFLSPQGDIIEEAHDVELNNNASFYRAILAVHKENYTYVNQNYSLKHFYRLSFASFVYHLII